MTNKQLTVTLWGEKEGGKEGMRRGLCVMMIKMKLNVTELFSQ